MKTYKLILHYPALLMAPIFSFWTFGGDSMDCCKKRNSETQQNLKISFRFTWINAIVTTLLILGLTAYYYYKYYYIYADYFDAGDVLFILFLCLPLLSLIIIQSLQKCQTCICTLCQPYCCPMFKKTAIDPDDPLTLIDISRPNNTFDTELRNQAGHIFANSRQTL